MKDIGIIRSEKQIGIPLRSATVVILVFYLVAGILNGWHLHESASQRPYGFVRNVWMMALAPVSAVTTWLHVEHLRQTVEQLRKVME